MEKRWFQHIYGRCDGLTCLVVGDVMIDRETHGSSNRLCPEAPVPVSRSFSDSRPPSTLGGAGNVARNLVGLGCKVYLGGLVGEGELDLVSSLCDELAISPRGIYGVDEVQTPIKRRYYVNGQMIFRSDIEHPAGFVSDDRRAIFGEGMAALIKDARPDVLIISDYGKGTMSQGVAHSVMSTAWRELFDNCIVLVDTKQHPEWYAKADLVTPNEAELVDLMGLPTTEADDQEAAARKWRRDFDVPAVVVTRGFGGASLLTDHHAVHNAGLQIPNGDPCGAGDALIAALGASLAAGVRPADALAFAVRCAGHVCRHPGVAPIRFTDMFPLCLAEEHNPESMAGVVRSLRARGDTIAVVNGCFDPLHHGHLEVFAEAARQAQRVIALVNDDDSVRHLKGESKPLIPLESRIAIVSQLADIDYVCPFSNEGELGALIELIDPEVIVRGSDHKGEPVTEPCPVIYVDRLDIRSSDLGG